MADILNLDVYREARKKREPIALKEQGFIIHLPSLILHIARQSVTLGQQGVAPEQSSELIMRDIMGLKQEYGSIVVEV